MRQAPCHVLGHAAAEAHEHHAARRHLAWAQDALPHEVLPLPVGILVDKKVHRAVHFVCEPRGGNGAAENPERPSAGLGTCTARGGSGRAQPLETRREVRRWVHTAVNVIADGRDHRADFLHHPRLA